MDTPVNHDLLRSSPDFVRRLTAYPASFTPDEDGQLLVRFRDIPEALTCGPDLEAAKIQAADALAVALEQLGRDVQPPSQALPDEHLIVPRRL